jgi:hypothetical protein
MVWCKELQQYNSTTVQQYNSTEWRYCETAERLPFEWGVTILVMDDGGSVAELLVVLFEVTVGLLLNYWSCCLSWQCGCCCIIGCVVWGDSVAVAVLLVVLFEVTVGLLLHYWSCCLWSQWGSCCIIGRVVWCDSGTVVELLVVLMDSRGWFWVLLGVLQDFWSSDFGLTPWWWCGLFNNLISVVVFGLSQKFLD